MLEILAILGYLYAGVIVAYFTRVITPQMPVLWPYFLIGILWPIFGLWLLVYWYDR